MTVDLKAHLRDYIVDTFLFGEGGDTLADDTSLIEAGIIDSTGVLEVVAMLQERFEVEIDDEELVPDNFDSLDKIAAFVERKRSATGGAR
jgi:acyl carrier protein